MQLDLELSRVIAKINDSASQRVAIQLPDGLKSRAEELQDKIKSQTGAEVFIWAGSCFGACDIPQGLESVGIDLLIQWGHSEWIS